MATSPAPARQAALQAAIKLGPGQSVHYDPSRPQGKRYYAGPAKGGGGYAPAPPLVSENGLGGGNGPGGTNFRPTPPARVPRVPAPRPPVDPFAASTPAAIDARAAAQAQSEIDPQKAEINRQKALADSQAAAQEAAITGFTKATGELEAGMSPAVSAAYSQATKDVGALGQGISGQVGSDLAASQAADDAFAQSQGQSGGHTTNAPDVATTLGMLEGVIPGSELAARGAAASAWAAEQPQIAIDAGRQELDKRLAQAKQDDDSYAQQLITLAATYPGLKAQALTQLNQYEMDKATYRMNLSNSKADNARQDRALRDQEQAAGISGASDAAKLNAEYTYKYAALNFKNQQDAKKAAAAGKIMDVGASKAMGYVVYKDGSSNKSIKVAQTGAGSAGAKAQQNKYKDTVTAKKTAVSEAISLLGKPQLAPKAGAGYLGGHGKYIAAKKYRDLGAGKPGSVFPDGTTNNLKRAAHSGDQYTFQQAQSLIFEKIGGETLMARYNLSRPQVMAWINSALKGAGWSK